MPQVPSVFEVIDRWTEEGQSALADLEAKAAEAVSLMEHAVIGKRLSELQAHAKATGRALLVAIPKREDIENQTPVFPRLLVDSMDASLEDQLDAVEDRLDELEAEAILRKLGF